jgi:hypothetical protein
MNAGLAGLPLAAWNILRCSNEHQAGWVRLHIPVEVQTLLAVGAECIQAPMLALRYSCAAALRSNDYTGMKSERYNLTAVALDDNRVALTLVEWDTDSGFLT